MAPLVSRPLVKKSARVRAKIIQKSRKEEVTFLFPVWDRWNHNKYLVQMTNPVIAISYNKLWWPSGKDTWLSHRQSGFKSRWDLFEEKFFLCLCFTKNLIPKSRNLYLSTPMDDFRVGNTFPNSKIRLRCRCLKNSTQKLRCPLNRKCRLILICPPLGSINSKKQNKKVMFFARQF